MKTWLSSQVLVGQCCKKRTMTLGVWVVLIVSVEVSISSRSISSIRK